MRFEITSRIHFGYMREPGVYEDLSEADALNLSAPRPGFPSGYGRTIDLRPMSAVGQEPETVVDDLPAEIVISDPDSPIVVEESTVEERTAVPPPVEAHPRGTGSDDPSDRPSDTPPISFACRGCAKDQFQSEVARNTHERQKHKRVLG